MGPLNEYLAKVAHTCLAQGDVPETRQPPKCAKLYTFRWADAVLKNSIYHSRFWKSFRLLVHCQCHPWLWRGQRSKPGPVRNPPCRSASVAIRSEPSFGRYATNYMDLRVKYNDLKREINPGDEVFQRLAELRVGCLRRAWCRSHRNGKHASLPFGK